MPAIPTSTGARIAGLAASLLLGVIGCAAAGLFVSDLLFRLRILPCIELECLAPTLVGFFGGIAAGLVVGGAVGVRIFRHRTWGALRLLTRFAAGALVLLALDRLTR